MPLPLIPLAIGGLSFLGGMFNNRERTTKNTSTTSSTLSPEASALNTQVLDIIKSRLSAPSALPAGYKESGISDINKVFDLVNQGQSANLTARGLSDSPVAAIGTGNARAGEISRFVTNLPSVERDFRNQDLSQAMQAFMMQPRTTTTTGTHTMPGNMLGGGFSDLATMLGFMMGQGGFGGAKTPAPTAGRGGPFDPRG